MNITIEPKNLSGNVKVVSSKSLSHRYLIAAGLAKGRSTISSVLESKDLDATKHALFSLGVKFQGEHVIGGNLSLIENSIDCYESGSTLRFMIPIALLQDKKVIFRGRGRLPERPLDIYFELFKQKGISFKRFGKHDLPLEVKGPLPSGDYEVKGNVSSQFITGLLFALPLTDGPSTLKITTPVESRGYIDLTLDVLKAFHIEIKEENQTFYIKGNQTYVPKTIDVEGDFSQAAFFIVAGLIGSSITLSNLNPNTKQGDFKIVEIITNMQGLIRYDLMSNRYVTHPSKTYGSTIDLSDIPDLGPILMILAALSEGTTTFVNASRLRIKESDRLEAMYQTLLKLGVDVKLDGDDMTIQGQKSFKGHISLDGYGDHRIVMAIAIAAIRAEGPITIIGAEAVTKSYPNFFEVYKNLGGIIYES